MLCKHTLGPWAPCSEREKHIFSLNIAINSAFCTLNVNKWEKTSDSYDKRQRKLTVSPRLPFCPRGPCKVYINQWVCWKTSAQRNVKASVMYKTYCSSIGTNNSYGTNNSSSTLKEKKKEWAFQSFLSEWSKSSRFLPLILGALLALLCPLAQSLLEAPESDTYLHTAITHFVSLA